jgi:hypothetical protein
MSTAEGEKSLDVIPIEFSLEVVMTHTAETQTSPPSAEYLNGLPNYQVDYQPDHVCDGQDVCIELAREQSTEVSNELLFKMGDIYLLWNCACIWASLPKNLA